MAFGRKARTPETPDPTPASEPQPLALSAQERLNVLQGEHDVIEATLTEHQEQRQKLLEDDGDLQRVIDLKSEDEKLRLRQEQLGLQLLEAGRALRQEQAEEWEAAWQTHRPVLAAAQAELVQTIADFRAALQRANIIFAQARNFGERLREFCTPPPLESYNEWALIEYSKAVERRQQPFVQLEPMLTVEVPIDTPPNVPPAERFVPRRVPHQLVDEISAIAPMRRVKLLHTVRASNLSVGHARLRAGQETMLSARAAFMVVYSGVGVYTDEAEMAEAATAATAAA